MPTLLCYAQQTANGTRFRSARAKACFYSMFPQPKGQIINKSTTWPFDMKQDNHTLWPMGRSIKTRGTIIVHSAILFQWFLGIAVNFCMCRVLFCFFFFHFVSRSFSFPQMSHYMTVNVEPAVEWSRMPLHKKGPLADFCKTGCRRFWGAQLNH